MPADTAKTTDTSPAPTIGDAEHTAQGAPTDAAHQAVGDGSLTGSIPAGLTIREMEERRKNAPRDDAGSE